MSGSISSLASTPTTASGTETTRASGFDSLGKQEFLKLLIAQLRNQDPMKPMEDREFIAQLAQFSALEAMQSLDARLEVALGAQLLTQATTFIGKRVEAKLADGSTLAGVVSEVRLVGGSPKLIVDGQSLELSQVSTIGT